MAAKHPSSMTAAERESARYRPAGWCAIRVKDGESVVYYGLNRDGRPAAWAYRGRAIKPAWRYMFRSDAERTKMVESFIRSIASRVEHKAKALAERRAFRHTLQVGDVLVSSWGYDQTNIDYYQVTRRTAKTVSIRPIAGDRGSNDGWTGDCVPKPGRFTGPESQHKVTPQNSVRIASYAYAHKVEPRLVGGVKTFPVSHWTAYA